MEEDGATSTSIPVENIHKIEEDDDLLVSTRCEIVKLRRIKTSSSWCGGKWIAKQLLFMSLLGKMETSC